MASPSTAPTAPSSCALVIFGASGDLAALKLLPAIYKLAEEKLLPEKFALVGYSRTKMSDDEFRARFREAASEHHDVDRALLDEVAGKIYYQPGQYDSAEDFDQLKSRLGDLEGKHGTGGNALFYLSTPPNTFAPIAQCLAQHERRLAAVLLDAGAQFGFGLTAAPLAQVELGKPHVPVHAAVGNRPPEEVL